VHPIGRLAPMAVQSLYRRYRPRRFDELRGQEHVVRALRNAVVNRREGQAYLFSGPRGTGKTSTARILAKVLNCESPEDGEPCGVCESCAAIDSGNSYDVLELDAASNNGVENVRDLIERSGLSSPGRHRVFILDEVHMLSKAAEAALLKTLEEPPPHVVFVLATTDPQKVSETIRSRTQHLQFHLLPMTELEEHVRYVVHDANLTVSEAAIQHVLRQGGGSARDTLSALELVAISGGDVEPLPSTDEFVEALADSDAARALAAVAASIQGGADPRGLTEETLRHLRECFLSLTAPELVRMPSGRVEVVADQARRVGLGRVVRAIETLGTALVEMRHAPDARLLLEVHLVKMCSPSSATDMESLVARIERLESSRSAPEAPRPAARPAPVNPKTGRAQVGGHVRRETTPAPTTPSSVAEGPLDDAAVIGAWPDVLSSLALRARAIYRSAAVRPIEVVGEELRIAVPNEAHGKQMEDYREAVEESLSARAGRPLRLAFVVTARDGSGPVPRRSTAAAAPVEDSPDEPERIDLAETEIETDESQVRRLLDAFPGSELDAGGSTRPSPQ
jgi:DNA polymerase-3 subunit gamma/tau